MKIRRITMIFIISIFMLASSTSMAFTDINGHWAESMIKSLKDSKIINGYKDGSFKPENNITRAEASKLIAELLAEEVKGSEAKFTDISKEDWSYSYISYLYNKGIIKGYEDLSFRPNEFIKRAEFAKMTYEVLNSRSALEDERKFFEDSDKHWAKDEIAILSGNSIINGKDNIRFKPEDNITRAEASKIIYLSIKKIDPNRIVNSENMNNFESAVITKVIDGDTVVVNIKGEDYKLRMIGIDTPESVHPNKNKNNICGEKASEYTKSRLTIGRTVYLEKDISDTDKYGRLLRYIWLDRPKSDEPNEIEIRRSMYNAELALEGYAKSATYPPDIKYSDLFNAFVREARENNLGLWIEENNCNPEGNKVVKAKDSVDQEVDLGKGSIKGNINSKGEKIYHVPGGAFYEKTIIGNNIGERYFETEEEAKAAGFRKSKR